MSFAETLKTLEAAAYYEGDPYSADQLPAYSGLSLANKQLLDVGGAAVTITGRITLLDPRTESPKSTVFNDPRRLALGGWMPRTPARAMFEQQVAWRSEGKDNRIVLLRATSMDEARQADLSWAAYSTQPSKTPKAGRLPCPDYLDLYVTDDGQALPSIDAQSARMLRAVGREFDPMAALCNVTLTAQAVYDPSQFAALGEWLYM